MYIGTENWTGEKFCEVFGVKFISVCVVFMANLDVSLFKNEIINDILHSWNYLFSTSNQSITRIKK